MTKLRSFIDEENVEIILFLNDADVPSIGVKDLDADEMVPTILQFPTLAVAERCFSSMTGQ